MFWQCSVCGYIHDGDAPPERCPKCGAPKEKFVQLGEDAAKLVERSRFTNQLLTALMGIGDELAAIAEDGLEDNLDPGCVGIFKYTQRVAGELSQMAKAEIKTHIEKGKWG